MMKGSIADVDCLFLYVSKKSCNAYAQLRSFFNLFMRIDMLLSRRHIAASEKNSICQNSAVCFYVLFLPESVWTLCRIFCMHSKENLPVYWRKCTNSVRIHSDMCQCGFLPLDPMVNSQGSKSAGCCAGIILGD